MFLNMTSNNSTIFTRLKENPIERDVSELANWIEGKCYEISPKSDPILCNIRVALKMHVRYVLIDEEYFALIEPDQQKQEDFKVKVHKKVNIKTVEAQVDKSEPRNLHVTHGFKSTLTGKLEFMDFLLYFENTAKCLYVKNLLDMSQKTAKFKMTNKVQNFIEKCKQDCLV